MNRPCRETLCRQTPSWPTAVVLRSSMFRQCQRYVKKQWSECGRTIAGERGYAAVHLQSVRKSHPAFPIFMVALAGCVVCCNGARLRLWGSLAPIVPWVINCSYTQTRKSGLAGIVEVFATVVGKRVHKAFRHIHRLKQVSATNPVKVEPAVRTVQEDEQAACSVPPMQEVVPAEASLPSVPMALWSIAYLGGTIDRCKERCAGDFNFCQSVKAFKDLPSVTESNLSASLREVAERSGLSGRTWFSSLLMFDEIYDFLMDLGVLANTSKKSSAGPDTSGQTPNSSWANRLMQTGTSSHETKTNGSFGGIDSPTVCTAVTGNFHPGVCVCVEMLRGLRGDHACMTKARLFFTSGAPVQPHEEYESCGVRAQVMFCPLPDVLRDLLNLKCLSSPEAAQKFFSPVGNDPPDDIGVEFSEDGYFPDIDGWTYVLPDGVATRIRFRRRDDDDIVAEWSMAVRDIDIPEEYDLEAAANRLADAFELDHRELRFTDDANLAFQSYSAYFNILVAQARQDEDIGQAAQMGCCPWKLGVLSASLALWDIAWQQHQAPVADQTQPVLVTVNVVSRAFGLLEILESIVAIMSGHSGTTAFASVAAAADATRKRKQSDEDHLSAQLQQSSPDKSWDPQAQHSGILDTELLRRLLMKAEKDTDTGPYIVKSRAIYNVARQKDKLAKSLAVSDFRSLAKAVPTALGSYDESKDCLVLALPNDDSDEFDAALLDRAKISSGALQAFWQNNCDKRKGKKR